MDLGLRGKRALVLGASRGLGLAAAGALAAEGAEIAMCARTAEAIAASASEIASNHGTRAVGYVADLAEAASVDGLGAKVWDDFGGLDILVLKSGDPPPGRPLDSETAESWTAEFESMFLNIVRLTEAFLPDMRKRGWGRIIISSTTGAIEPLDNLGLANAFKSALAAWAKTLANEVAQDGVTVNTILPWRVHTGRIDMLDRRIAQREGITLQEARARNISAIPVGRYGRVDEFAAIVAFLASENASYINGALIRNDGGAMRGI